MIQALRKSSACYKESTSKVRLSDYSPVLLPPVLLAMLHVPHSMIARYRFLNQPRGKQQATRRQDEPTARGAQEGTPAAHNVW